MYVADESNRGRFQTVSHEKPGLVPLSPQDKNENITNKEKTEMMNFRIDSSPKLTFLLSYGFMA